MRQDGVDDLPALRTERWLAWERGPASVDAWVVAIAFAALLGMAILRSATGRPEWLLAWRVSAAVLSFASVLVLWEYLWHVWTDAGGTDRRRLAWTLLRLGLLAVLLAVTSQSQSPGVGLGVDRLVEGIAILATLAALCVVAGDPRRYTPGQWVVVGCFVTVAGIFFVHGLGVAEASVRSRHPLWAALVMGTCLVVLPQYLPEGLFLWALSRVAAVVVLLGVLAYALGEYRLLGTSIRFHDAFAIPLVDREVRAIRSLFVNRNAFAMVVLAGIVASTAEFHRAVRRDDGGIGLAVPTGLLVVNAVGLAVSFGRALWVIAVPVLGIYLASALFGRPAVPAAVVGGAAYLLGGILAVYVAVRTGLLASDPSDRFHLWAASLAAILDRPSLFGEGVVSPAVHILEYRDTDAAASPHNSYLSVWIRTGVVGGLAYVGLVLASLVDGTLRYRDVDVAVLAVAALFAAHQVFEAYTMLWWTTGSVYASLAIGFLTFGGARRRSPP